MLTVCLSHVSTLYILYTDNLTPANMTHSTDIIFLRKVYTNINLTLSTDLEFSIYYKIP